MGGMGGHLGGADEHPGPPAPDAAEDHHMGAGERESVRTAVRDWWDAWERQDLERLRRLAREDYVEFTGHSEGPRVGRDTLLTVARRAFEEFAITGWQLGEILVQDHGRLAVAAYRWREDIRREDGAFRLSGVATDVLVLEDGRWRYVAHHGTVTERSPRRSEVSGSG